MSVPGEDRAGSIQTLGEAVADLRAAVLDVVVPPVSRFAGWLARLIDRCTR